MIGAELARAELSVRLGALLRGVRPAVARRAERTAALARPEISHLAITEQHAYVVLAEAESFAFGGRAYGPGTAPTPSELTLLELLAEQAREAGVELPGSTLLGRGLSTLDVEILLLAAAPALDPCFGTLYAYVHDAAASVQATPYLAIEVLARDHDDECRVVEACGPFGTLRADGLLTVSGQQRTALTALQPADGVVELLCGSRVDPGLLGRRCSGPVDGSIPAGMVAELVAQLACALASRAVDVVGVWGAPGGGERAVVAALVGERAVVHATAAEVEVGLQRASIYDAVCVVDVPPDDDAATRLADRVAASSATVVLVGAEPLRTPRLMSGRRFAELRIPAHGYVERLASWSAAFPDMDSDRVEDLAARFRLRPDDVAAVAALERTADSWCRNGHRPKLDALAALVSRRRSSHLATIRTPERGPEMLVLPRVELAQVLEVAASIRAWPRIAEGWGLKRFGNPGVTALFAGDPGTGKTLAAEVIATLVGIDLMVVDLSRLVSKWIGETEKNLDAVFSEAEASNCVLFFDEADSIFGQRGEVTRGADRYANLEVGYLLQRLERYEGLVILASNLRGNLDPAFTRRFHHVVHFPRPGEAERRRLWEVALEPPVQVAEPLDLGVLAGLELNGASIAAIVRSAALAVHADGRRALTVPDVLRAINTQYQREARLLPREMLGPYADLFE